MLRLKYLIANCVLALALSLGMNLAWPSYSSASSLYTFTFNESASQNEVVTGYFSIPVSDFSAAVANTEFFAFDHQRYYGDIYDGRLAVLWAI